MGSRLTLCLLTRRTWVSWLITAISLLALWFQGVFTVKAQQPAFRCTQITTEDGLSDNMVFCALQDRQGFIWFGTRDGLNKYDGYKFTVYRHNPKDSTSLSGNSVSCLFEDSKGNLWVGTGGMGLNKLNDQKQTFTRYKHIPGNPRSICEGKIDQICEDNDGMLWIVTALPTPHLQKFNPGTGAFQTYKPSGDKYSISSNLVTSVCKDSLGALWIGTFEKGLNRYDKTLDGFINYHTCPSYGFKHTGNIVQMYVDREKDFLVQDTTLTISLLKQYAPNSFRREGMKTHEYSIQDVSSITTLHRDRLGYIWAGSTEAGIYIINWDKTSYLHYTSEPKGGSSISNGQIMHITSDNSDNIWICTADGVYRFHHQTRYFQHFGFQYIEKSPSTQTVQVFESSVRSLRKDSEGTLWVGTSGQGVYKTDAHGRKHIRMHSEARNDFDANTINLIYQDSHKNLFFGTNAGIHKANVKKTRLEYSPLDITGWRIWSLLEDKRGNLWIGSLHEGLTKIDVHYRSGTRMLQSHSNTEIRWGQSNVFAIYEDRKNNLWFGTNQGLHKLNNRTQQWQPYTSDIKNPFSISSHDIWYIHEAHDGIIWLATSGGGLNRLDPTTQKFTHITQEDGLPSNIICAILEDKHGNLWISTNKGLARFNPKTHEVRTFGVNDGLYISEFHFKTCFQDTDGSMYFGGTGGYVHFHPDSIAANPRAPKMAFTSFKVFDKELQLDTTLPYKKVITLSHTNNFFTAEFAALDFSNPVKNQYRYKLEGVDEQWRETDGRRPYASYTNVAPGEYTLHVQGSNSDEVWNTEGIRLMIVIEPAWWQTLWFKTAILLCAVLLIAVAVWWRYRSLQRRNEVERKLVESQLQSLRSQMNPHFIFNSLNSILHFITSNDPETAHTFLSKFSKLIRAILEQSKSEFIPLSEELYVLELYLELEALRFDNRFCYSITVGDDIDVEEQQIPPMLLQPHVENAIKHGLIHTVSDGKIEIVIRRENDSVVCSVIDNGIGRHRSQKLKSNSLHKHVSRGTALTQDRLDILNTLHSEKYGIAIEDLTDDKGSSRGTRVDVKIAPDIVDT